MSKQVSKYRIHADADDALGRIGRIVFRNAIIDNALDIVAINE